MLYQLIAKHLSVPHFLGRENQSCIVLGRLLVELVVSRTHKAVIC